MNLLLLLSGPIIDDVCECFDPVSDALDVKVLIDRYLALFADLYVLVKLHKHL